MKKILDQNKTPLVTALLKYAADMTIPFHVPGHKQGRGNRDLEALLGSTCLNIDLTCLEDTDNICNPVSVIKEAQALAAEIYGAQEAFFLTNGTTSGIQAMILSVCQPGDKIVIPRNAHKSAIGGLILSGAEPIYLEPEIHDHYGISMGITPEAVREVLVTQPGIKAVFVINPSYYGIASNLREIVEIAHSFGVPVIVDEAHGAHLPFDNRLPLSAMEAGADLSASSTHKLGGSLTQSSILLQQGKLINPKRVKSALNLTQTTSPSYILLASLDIARKQLAMNGNRMVQEAYDLAIAARTKLSQVPGLQVMDADVVGQKGCLQVDPTKIVVNVRALGLSGYEVEKLLRKKYGIQVELSDLFNIIALVSIGDNQATMDCLVRSLTDIAESQTIKNVVKYYNQVPSIPAAVVSPREAYYADTKTIRLDEAEGEISAESIMAYPPGIPIVCPGERITKEVIEYVNVLRNEDAVLQGTEDPKVKRIKVLAKHLVLVRNQENVI